MEGMACLVPQIVPDWSALGDWPRGGVCYVPCTSTSMNPGGINTIGGVVDRVLMIEALEKMYQDKDYRDSVAKAGFDLVSRAELQWTGVASKFDSLFRSLITL